MRFRIACMACAAFAVGCASAGGGAVELSPVPLYVAGSTVPCEYDVIRTLRRSSAVRPRSQTDYERMRADLLGRAGAEIGADAVLVDRVEDATSGTQRRAVVTGGPPPSGFQFEGRAIRFRMETCR
jgi:hypothetical protein